MSVSSKAAGPLRGFPAATLQGDPVWLIQWWSNMTLGILFVFVVVLSLNVSVFFVPVQPSLLPANG